MFRIAAGPRLIDEGGAELALMVSVDEIASNASLVGHRSFLFGVLRPWRKRGAESCSSECHPLRRP